MAITNYCECDNTHEAHDTVCQFCWEQGHRICQKCKTEYNVNEWGTDLFCQNCTDDYWEKEIKAGRA